ncbi:MAG: glycosyltransferase family 4 protein [Pseudomonadota bacterium]
MNLRILMVDRAGAQSIWSIMGVLRGALEARGHEVHTCRWDDGGGACEDRFVPGPRDHVIEVPPRRNATEIFLQHRQFAHAFVPLLKKLKPAAVHVNFVVPGAIVALLARRSGVPLVLATRHELARSMAPHLRLFSALAARSIDVKAHVSKVVADSYGVSNAPLRGGARSIVIHNGLDLNSLARISPWPCTAGATTIIVCGRMVAVKGHARTLPAFRLAAAKDPTLRLEFVGDGPMRPALEAEVARLGLGMRVAFHGWRPREETLSRMRSAALVVVPSSKVQEGFGLVLAEAMAMQCSIVASDIAVFREVAALGHGVCLLETTNPQALADVMLCPPPAASADPAKLDQSAMIAAYLALYEAEMGTRRLASPKG